MTMNDYQVDDVVEMKKEHPCHKSMFLTMIRDEADIKIKCQGCGAVVMFPRYELERKMKKIVEKSPRVEK